MDVRSAVVDPEQVDISGIPAAPAADRRVRGVAGVAALAAGLLLAVAGLFGLSRDVADATTTLVSPVGVTLRAPDGSTRQVAAQTDVDGGSTVEVAAGGSAMLVTRGREVLLGGGAAVTVVDGARQVLRRGQVMVDGRDAPGLELDAGAAQIEVPDDGVVRLERTEQVRAAAFARPATVQASGRRAVTELPPLHQVQVPFGGLPGRTTPLALSRDAWELRVARALVEDDAALTLLADGFAVGAASTVLAALPAPAPRGASGEQALSAVLAQVGGGGDVAARTQRVRALRADGGSWGVVAALVDADVDRVTSLLERLLQLIQRDADAEPGADAADSSAAEAVAAAARDRAAGQPRPRPGRSTSTARPTSSPSPSPSQPQQAVDQVVDTVLDLLPSPVASAVPTLTPPAPPSLPSVR